MRTNEQGNRDWASPKPVLWLAGTTVAWLATLAIAKFGPGGLWGAQNDALSGGAVGLNAVAGVVWIIAFSRYLRSLDELWRRINLNALAITLGAGWVAGFAHLVAQGAGLVGGGLSPALLAAGMGVVYLAAVFGGLVRYR